MLKVRIIPVLTFDGLSLVKTKQFSNPRTVGNPIQAARVYNIRNVDELVFIDIKATFQNRKINLSLVRKIINECFMPVTIGGGIQTFEDINDLLRIGADKVVIKTKAIKDPKFISDAVSYFGSQCISISVDTIFEQDSYWIYNNEKTSLLLEDFLSIMKTCKVGEFLVNSINKDGMQMGYDNNLYKKVMTFTQTPVVAIGGAGKPSDFNNLVKSGFQGGMAAASIFHFTQFTPMKIKESLIKENVPVRL